LPKEKSNTNIYKIFLWYKSFNPDYNTTCYRMEEGICLISKGDNLQLLNLKENEIQNFSYDEIKDGMDQYLNIKTTKELENNLTIK